MHSISLGLADAWSDFYISWRIIIKLIRSKLLFLWYTFTFNVVITHEIITFQDICMGKMLKDFSSIKDTYYAALRMLWRPPLVSQFELYIYAHIFYAVNIFGACNMYPVYKILRKNFLNVRKCCPFNWPIRSQETNMRYDTTLYKYFITQSHAMPHCNFTVSLSLKMQFRIRLLSEKNRKNNMSI